ncbi:endonuclease domain-containing protein [Flavobacterium sp. Arc2]|uniref:endonuclease domain-containing protein n=1 Tax=Flavobacterium sp. Arc2 TaxID=3046685 RepID=UPI00352C67EB
MKKNPLLSDTMWKSTSEIIFSNAKKLRENPTQAEELMWLSLRNNQLEGCKFRRQHPLLNYVADFYCHQLKLVVEIDGEYHQTVEQKKLDKERTVTIEFQGLDIIRFTNDEVLTDINTVLNKIKKFIQLKLL